MGNIVVNTNLKKKIQQIVHYCWIEVNKLYVVHVYMINYNVAVNFH